MQTTATKQSVAQTGLFHAMSPAKTIGSALTSVIKTAGKQPIQCAMAARRMLQYLQEDIFTLYFEPDTIYIDDEVVLEMDEGQNMWILPLYIVGVRSITFNEMTSTVELMSLGYEVSNLRLHSEAMEAFRDWIWSDGAGSVDIEISETFMDVMELMDVGDVEELRGFGTKGAQVRASAIDRVRHTMKLHENELTIAALRPEFQTSIDLFTQGMKYRGFEMIDAERKALNFSTTNPMSWLVSELHTLLDNEALQQHYPAFRFAHTIVDQLNAKIPTPFIEAMVALHQHESIYAKQLVDALYKIDFADKLGLHMDLSNDIARQQVMTLFAHLSPQQLTDCTHALIRRIQAVAGDRPHLEALIRQLTADRWSEAVGHELPDALAPTHVSLILSCDVRSETLATVVDSLEDATAVTLIGDLPDVYLPELEARLQNLFVHAERRVVEELLPTLLERRLTGVVDMIAMIMLKQKNIGWSSKTIKTACRAVLDYGMGEKYLVPMVRSRNVTQVVREIALETLEKSNDDKLLEQASKFRLMEFFDPTDFRERLRSNRTKTKSNPKLRSPEDE